VVVVVAMAEIKQPGDKVGSVRHTFGRTDSNPEYATQQMVYLASIDGVEKDTEYFVEFKSAGRSNIDYSDQEPFLIKTHSSQCAFNVPRRILNENDILPGHCAFINLYEVDKVKDEQTDFIDDSSIIGRTTVVSNKSNSDNCRSSLRDKKIYKYIGDGEMNLKLRNVKNGKETYVLTSQNGSGRYEFSFPISKREALDAEPGDLIEVIDVDAENDNDSSPGLPRDEKIDAMYEMVSELYDAYTAAKND